MAKRVMSARALRWLFAKGILRSRGSGKNREVTYDRKKAAALKSGGTGYKGKERIRNAQGRTIGRQAAGTSTFRRKVGTGKRKDAGNNLNSNANAFPRTVIGGSKAARLRSGSAGGASGSGRASRIANARRQTERGVLPGGWREHRKAQAGLARSERNKARRFDEQANYYKEQGNMRGFEAQSSYAAEARGKARQIVAQAKRDTPRLSVADARALSRETKAQNVAERKAETAALRASKTIAAVRQAQRNTYNGWSSDLKKQKSRYARLKNLERAIQRKYGV